MQHGELRSNCGFQACQVRLLDLINFKDTFKTGETHCSTSSSSSSSSPTVNDTKTREREDRIESDISPVTLSTTVDERSGDPMLINPIPKKKEKQKEGETRCWRNGETRYILKSRSGCENSEILVDERVLEHRDTRQFFSWSFFRADYKETWGFGQAQCLYSFP